MAAAAGKSSGAHLWRGRITAQQASGESIRGWCRSNGCHEHSFYWWRAKLGLSLLRCGPKTARSLEFSRVVVADPVAERVEPIRLVLVGGRELILPASMPLEQVVRLVHAIESPAAAGGSAA